MDMIDIAVKILARLVYYIYPILGLWMTSACVLAWWRTQSFPALTLHTKILFGKTHKSNFSGKDYLSTAVNVLLQCFIWGMQFGNWFGSDSTFLNSFKVTSAIVFYTLSSLVLGVVATNWRHSPGYAHPSDLLLFQQPHPEFWRDRAAPHRAVSLSGAIVIAMMLISVVLVTFSVGAQPCRWLDLIIQHSGCVRVLNWNTQTSSMAVSPDHKWAAQAQFREETLFIYNLDSGEVVHELIIPNPREVFYQRLSFSRSGNFLLASGERHMHIWDIPAKKILHEFKLPEFEWILVINRASDFVPPDAKVLASLTDGTQVLAWRGYPDHIETLSSDSRVTAVAEKTRVAFRRTQDFGVISAFTSTMPPDFQAYRTVFSPDNSLFAFQDHESNSVLLWRVVDGAFMGVFTMPDDRQKAFRYISTLAISPKNKWLAAGSADGTVRVWNISDRQLVRTFDHVGFTAHVRQLFFINSNDIVAASSYGSMVQWHISAP
jgi:hypothetical protein